MADMPKQDRERIVARLKEVIGKHAADYVFFSVCDAIAAEGYMVVPMPDLERMRTNCVSGVRLWLDGNGHLSCAPIDDLFAPLLPAPEAPDETQA